MYAYPGDLRKKKNRPISDPLHPSERLTPRQQRELIEEARIREKHQQKKNNDSAKPSPTSTRSSFLSALSPMQYIKRPSRRRPENHLETVISNMGPPPPQVEPKVSRTRPRSQSLPNLEDVVCAHPIHYHSFTSPSSVLSFVRSRFRTCVKCDQLLLHRSSTEGGTPSGGGGGITSTTDVLVCLACGAFVHRSCGISSCNEDDGSGWKSVCEVNRKLFERRRDMWDALEQMDKENDREGGTSATNNNNNQQLGPSDNDDADTIWSADGPPVHWALSSPSALQGLKPMSAAAEKEDEGEKRNGTANGKQYVSFSGMSRALQENVLANWLNLGGGNKDASILPEIPKELISRSRGNSIASDGNDTTEGDASVISNSLIIQNTKEEEGQDTRSDKNVSGCSKDGVVINIDSPDETTKDGNHHPEKQESVMGNCVAIMEEVSHNIKSSPPSTNASNSPTSAGDDDDDDDDEQTPSMETLLTHKKTRSTRKKRGKRPKLKTTLETLQTLQQSKSIIQTTANTPKNVAVASVLGGFAGGVVGLLVAGPAGAYTGSNIGRVALVAGVAIESSRVVAGVAGDMMKRKNDDDGGGKRMLAIGEKGTEQKVVMVRPNVVVDPIWEEFTLEAKRLAQAMVDVSGKGRGKIQDARLRRLRDVDIAKTDEGEIGTTEKVMLLVSSSLNDRTSIPGHVYRQLIREHQNREKERRRLRWEEDMVVLVDEGCESDSDEDGTKMDVCRTTRDDTHAVIKHVTSTLLEVRPGFGASARMTEMTATAVEALVFGEVYDSVFREIVDETRGIDEDLMLKISEFQIEVGRKLSFDSISETSSHSSSSSSGITTSNIMVPARDIEEFVSDDALRCLRMLPESYTVSEKLLHCVQFLGFIASSSHFQAATNEKHPNSKVQTENKKKTIMGADSLLKLVCQHIIVAKVPNLNAEIVFLEEFARDEQLLKGKEGYALVTLQASLHFMNSSTDFGRDIFYDEDD